MYIIGTHSNRTYSFSHDVYTCNLCDVINCATWNERLKPLCGFKLGNPQGNFALQASALKHIFKVVVVVAVSVKKKSR